MPRINAYIIGHGSWKPADGYAKVPAGCSISFYTDFAKTMSGEDADRIVAGTLKRAPHRKIEQYMMAPNMRYTPDSQENMADFQAEKQKGTVLIYTTNDQGQTLRELFETMAVRRLRDWDLHWTACSALSLRETGYDGAKFVGNPTTGVNLTELEDGYYNFDYDINHYTLRFPK